MKYNNVFKGKVRKGDANAVSELCYEVLNGCNEAQELWSRYGYEYEIVINKSK